MSDEEQPENPAPRRNSHLIGQTAAEQTLLRAWRSGRLHHAWLLTGPRGIGKATLAFRFARFALAGGGSDLLAGAMPSLAIEPTLPEFRQVASGGHPDLMTVERGYDEKKDRLRAEIVVNDVRSAGEFLHLTAAAGGWRVVVVDSADEMNRNAANALLKLLEEPPQQSLLLLVSHAPGRLLPTIRSRCRRLVLAPLGDNDFNHLLTRYRPEMELAERKVLTQLAGGSIGRALEIDAGGGLELYREIAGQMLALPKIDGERLHALGDKVAKGGADGPFRLATELLLGWLGRAMRSGATGNAGAELIPGEGEGMLRLCRPVSLDQWLELWEKITRLFARTEAINLDRKQAWVGAMLEIGGMAGR